jgi:hypothetical protein
MKQTSQYLSPRWALKAVVSLLALALSSSALAQVEASEIYCTIRETGAHLNCQWVGKEARRSMTPEETAQFIDKAQVAAYMSVRSRRGMERVFMVDADSVPFKKLAEMKRTGSISEIARAKFDLFAEIERKAIKISDDLDAQNSTMELVKYDSSIATDKYKRELRHMDQELVNLKAELDQRSASNKAYEKGPEKVDPKDTDKNEVVAEVAAPAQQQSAPANQAQAELQGRSMYYPGRWTAFAGLGASNYSSSGTGAVSYSATVTDLAAYGRYVLSDKWIFEADVISGSSANFNTTAISPLTTELRANYCFGGRFCLAADVDPTVTYVGQSTTTRGIISPNGYTESFAGLSFAYLYKAGSYIMTPRIGYLTGTSYTSISAGTTTVTADSRAYFTYDVEKYFTAHQGIDLKFYYFSIGANTKGGAVTSASSTEAALMAYYAYTF